MAEIGCALPGPRLDTACRQRTWAGCHHASILIPVPDNPVLCCSLAVGMPHRRACAKGAESSGRCSVEERLEPPPVETERILQAAWDTDPHVASGKIPENPVLPIADGETVFSNADCADEPRMPWSPAPSSSWKHPATWSADRRGSPANRSRGLTEECATEGSMTEQRELMPPPQTSADAKPWIHPPNEP